MKSMKERRGDKRRRRENWIRGVNASLEDRKRREEVLLMQMIKESCHLQATHERAKGKQDPGHPRTWGPGICVDWQRGAERGTCLESASGLVGPLLHITGPDSYPCLDFSSLKICSLEKLTWQGYLFRQGDNPQKQRIKWESANGLEITQLLRLPPELQGTDMTLLGGTGEHRCPRQRPSVPGIAGHPVKLPLVAIMPQRSLLTNGLCPCTQNMSVTYFSCLRFNKNGQS